eukprot:SAG22_NODE_13297_length_411_cov_0.977564_1_plen_76_part_10
MASGGGLHANAADRRRLDGAAMGAGADGHADGGSFTSRVLCAAGRRDPGGGWTMRWSASTLTSLYYLALSSNQITD